MARKYFEEINLKETDYTLFGRGDGPLSICLKIDLDYALFEAVESTLNCNLIWFNYL